MTESQRQVRYKAKDQILRSSSCVIATTQEMHCCSSFRDASRQRRKLCLRADDNALLCSRP